VTFHRAIDWTPSLEQALEHVIEAGATRVLTSGGKQTAMQGVENLTHMVERAAGRIGVMVCGRIRKENISEIAKKTKAVEFHAALRKKTRSPVTYENPGLSLGELGIDEFARYAVTAADVRALHQAMLLAQDGVFMKSAPHVS
jgi:copper homeostasis protein